MQTDFNGAKYAVSNNEAKLRSMRNQHKVHAAQMTKINSPK